MNYNPGIWYNELYRIFSGDVLLTVAQTIKVGQCLRALQAGENIEYRLNDLYYEFQNNKEMQENLDRYIHAYLKNQEEVSEDAENQQEHGWFTL